MIPKIILFDWGDTLMIDFPDSKGKMCDWKHVEAIEGAKQTLSGLHQQGIKLYLATGADESTEQDIIKALERVELSQYFTGVFCKANLGISKGTAEFYHQIIASLSANSENIIMVGDSLNTDIEPAIQAGLKAIWFNPQKSKAITDKSEICHITKLTELLCVQKLI